MLPTLALLALAQPPANLDFATGRLTGWEGHGFRAVPAGGERSGYEATSADAGAALLHRTFTVPPGTAYLHCSAAAVRAAGVEPAGALDILVEASGRRFLPRQVRTPLGWRPAPQLLPPDGGAPREYRWDLHDFGGQLVRVALLDRDERPGCHVSAGGFRLVGGDGPEVRAFTDFMTRLVRDHGLDPVTRHDSRHFVALSNADDGFVAERLANCELMYELFFPHFRKKGFLVKEPAGRLMAAVFNTRAGFDAYLGRPLAPSVTGLYDPPTNRLLVYDYADNPAFVAARERGEREARQVRSDLHRRRALSDFNRWARDVRADLNLVTVMHETAHQLSFNGGLLNRHGDAPAWLVEGLACYCEASAAGGWQGPGEPNPLRAGRIARTLRDGKSLLPLRDLLESDAWLRAPSDQRVALGYSQSWALFRMLMEERPRQLRDYLTLIYPRRTPEHRLADFAQCFGSDLAGLESRYTAYLRDVAASQARPEW